MALCGVVGKRFQSDTTCSMGRGGGTGTVAFSACMASRTTVLMRSPHAHARDRQVDPSLADACGSVDMRLTIGRSYTIAVTRMPFITSSTR